MMGDGGFEICLQFKRWLRDWKYRTEEGGCCLRHGVEAFLYGASPNGISVMGGT